MAIRLLIFACWLSVVFGCTYHKNPGLLLNSFQTTDPGLLVLTNRTIDTNVAYGGVGGVADIQFTSPIDIMQSSALNYWIRVCDHGILQLADTQANLENCTTQASAAAITTTNPQPVIVADAISESTMTLNYTAEVYHIQRSEQLGSDGNITGPSFCDIEIIEGMINDCEEDHRYNQTVQEFAVVTWNIGNSGYMSGPYLFQAVVTVTTENRTYVMFLYNEYRKLVGGGNSVEKGIIHAANTGLSGSVRFSQICDSVAEIEIHLKSNCRCGQQGHYIFETTETTPGIHGFCGTESGKDTCKTQPSVDDSTNTNRNCRTPDTPQATCDAAVYCLRGTNDEIIVKFKNYNTNRVSFVNFTQFTQNDGSTGHQAPYGDNVHVIDAGVGSCTFTVPPSNGTFENITVSVPSSANCFEVEAATSVINFVLLFWNSDDGVNVTSLYTRYVTGSCDLDDLPIVKNSTIKAGDIASTTVPSKSGAKLQLIFYDRRSTNSPQQFDYATTSIQLGRMIFPHVCFTYNLPFTPNVDPYGVYVHSCQLSNNPEFINSTSNVTIDVIQSNGCLTSTPGPGQAGRFVDYFKRDSLSISESTPFCVTSGGFQAFRWDTDFDSTFIYMRCVTGFCRNTQLFPFSKCKDSCSNTIVDDNVTDVDDARRRKRQLGDVDEQIVDGVIEVVDTDPADQEQVTFDSSKCVDQTVAKSIIGALVALLIISTILTIILFFMLRSTKMD